MNKKFNMKLFLLLSFMLAGSITAISQVTTASFSVVVTNDKKQTVPNATVTISNKDFGLKKSIVTNTDGRVTLTNLTIGGGYDLEISSSEYNVQNISGITLELGQNPTIDVLLKAKSTTLGEVVITSNKESDKKNGASTTINNRLIKALPTISRSADDYLRLTPSASPTINGISFAGRNGQYNNFSLDGAVFNNPFGLDAPTPGGQTNAQPISLDAIEQIKVNIAPYDVTQAGFTGAGVNSVTKSGTNTTKGSVYLFGRNQDLTGKKVDGTKFSVPKLNQMQYGGVLGGAIKKDKLFYFIGIEGETLNEAPTSYVARNGSNAGKSNTSRVLQNDLDAVRTILKSKFGYETGDYQNFTYKQKNVKWLAKLDWNINNDHKLTLSYNGLDASKEKPAHPSAIGRRGPDFTTLQFRNSGYQIVNKLNSFNAELKSTFGSRFANKLRAVYTMFRDKRNPLSAPFPSVNITKNNVNYIIAGHEPFSINNRLNQDAFQLTNNFNIFLKKHTITIGASYESYKFGNSFNLVGYGPALFSSADIQTFKDSVPVSGRYVFGAYPLDVDVNYARKRLAADKWSWYYLTVGQLSFYAQDEFNINNKLNISVGLRADKPTYNNLSFSSPNMNPDGTFGGTYTNGNPTVQNNDNLTIYNADGTKIFNGAGKDLDNTKLPSKSILLSPRVGFNYKLKDDNTMVLRGGTGLFTGRFPFVWLGNAIGNPFSFFYCATDKNFKWPQVWRTNIGFDARTKDGTIITTDIAYTKDVNGMMVRNYKLGKPTGILNSGTGDKRAIYKSTDQGTDNVYVFTNTSIGYQFNASIQAQRTFKKGIYAMVAYNYLVAKDASSISAEISSDAFDRNPILGNANSAELTPSLYGNTHRIITAASKRFEYGRSATTVSLFGSWTSGNRFAYVYGGDINNDGTGSNDLLYVPTDAEVAAMNFAPFTDINGNVQSAATQRTAFINFVNQDKYLKSKKGSYTEKYGGTTPWFSQIDVRILQDFYFNKKRTGKYIQLSIDVVNAGNLISSKWGVRKYATTSGYFQPISVNAGGGSPVYQFDPSQTRTFQANPELNSRWQMQVGIRYIF